MELSDAQIQVLKLLLEGNTVTAAAEQAGIHRTTVHHWCRTKPEFVHALDGARRNRHALLHDEMDRLAASAIAVLEKTLADESAPPAVRVKAALAVVQGLVRVDARKPLLPRSVAENVEIENFLRTMENEVVAERDHINLAEASRAARTPPPPPPASPAPPLSRNSTCPCGSGAKYKRCCGVNAPPVLHAQGAAAAKAA